MKKLKKWISTPLRRVGTGFLLMMVGGGLSMVFPPFALVGVAGLYLFFMWGQWTETQWTEGKQAHCPICGKETPTQLGVLRSYMCLPLPFVGPILSCHVDDDYILACGECMETHVEDKDLASLLVIAQGGLAHAKVITEEEYQQLLK